MQRTTFSGHSLQIRFQVKMVVLHLLNSFMLMCQYQYVRFDDKVRFYYIRPVSSFLVIISPAMSIVTILTITIWFIYSTTSRSNPQKWLTTKQVRVTFGLLRQMFGIYFVTILPLVLDLYLIYLTIKTLIYSQKTMSKR